MIAEVLLRAKNIELPQKVSDYCEFLYYQFVAKEGYRKELVIKLLDEFKENEIKVAVLKGYAVALLYHAPDCRISGDVDLLVAPADEKAALKLLERQGFTVEQRAVMSHHSEAHSKEIGVVELHTALYDNDAENLWFAGVSTFDKLDEDYIVEDGIPALGCTDHLIFLTLHMMKHFIGGGLSLRMMLDVGLFFLANRAKIDEPRFFDSLDKLNFSKTVRVIFSILGCYCGLNFEQESDELMSAVLSDMNRGGAFGKKDVEVGQASARDFSRSSKRTDEYEKLQSEKLKIYRMRRFFPTYRTLKAEYPVLQSCCLLYPFIWAWRLITHTLNYLSKRTKVEKPPVIADSRAELMEMLGLK